MQTFIESRPHLGILASAGGALSALLSHLGLINQCLGFGAALFGFAAGFFTVMIKWREWRRGRK